MCRAGKSAYAACAMCTLFSRRRRPVVPCADQEAERLAPGPTAAAQDFELTNSNVTYSLNDARTEGRRSKEAMGAHGEPLALRLFRRSCGAIHTQHSCGAVTILPSPGDDLAVVGVPRALQLHTAL